MVLASRTPTKPKQRVNQDEESFSYSLKQSIKPLVHALITIDKQTCFSSANSGPA